MWAPRFDEDKCQVVYEGASKAAQEFFALLAKSEEVDGKVHS